MRLAVKLAAQVRPFRDFGAPIAVAFLAAFGLIVSLLVGSGDDGASSATARSLTATASPSRAATATPFPRTGTPSPSATPAAGTPSPMQAAGATPAAGESGPAGPAAESGMRMVIPKIGVNAPVTIRVMGSDGQMGAPNGRFDVVWYDFSAWPGMGGYPGSAGNAVFSGHVDYHPHYEAVFWDLRQIVAGDIIEVHLGNGEVARYAVRWAETISPDADFSAYCRDTGEATITIVTCQGTFNPNTRQYNQRLVVRGALLP